MATEYRRIVFSPKETVRAIVDYRKWRKDPLPEGRFVKFEMRADPISADFSIHAGGDAPREFAAAADELASALILFCINNKIPIPAKSKKDIKYVGEKLALTITIDEHDV